MNPSPLASRVVLRETPFDTEPNPGPYHLEIMLNSPWRKLLHGLLAQKR
jgi:hypothetical protein